MTFSDPFEWAKSQGIEQVRLMIYQPRVDGMTEFVVTLAELAAFAEMARQKAQRVEQAAAEFKTTPFAEWWPIHLNPTPNEVECAFCRAMPNCPSAHSYLQKVVGEEFFAVADAGQVSKTDPAAISDEELAAAMQAMPFLEEFAKAVRAEVERRLIDGMNAPDLIERLGYGLELGRAGNRRFTDEEAVEQYLRKTVRLSESQLYEFKLKSPTQIEKLAKPGKDENGNPTKPVLGAQRWQNVASYIGRADPVPSVKPRGKIKTPYVIPHATLDDFPAVTEAAPPADDDPLY